MDITLFPTKGNLILAKNTLRLSKQGYELLDKKRNILIREMMEQIGNARDLQSQIDTTFSTAYLALQTANIIMGISTVKQIGYSIPIDDSVQVKYRSIMGVEIPIITMDESPLSPAFGIFKTHSSLDEAYSKFDEVKRLIRRLAEVENTIYRLANNIKKTQKRANALKNVIIPRYEALTVTITNALEEKEREEFTRLKVIKNNKQA